MTPARRYYRYLGAALGLWLSVSFAVHAQSVVGTVTTGAAIPENAPVTTTSATPATGRSQTLNFGVTLGMGETDNITQTPTNAQSQTMALVGIDFGWIRTGSALNANVIGDFTYLDYIQGAYASQLLGRFDGLTSLSLFQDHLKWFLQDDFGEGQLDPYAPATPSNLEHVNFLTTGPELTLRPISDTVLQMGARYALATYQISPLNGWRTTENVQVEHLLSPNSNVALGADAAQLRFDDTTISPEYDRDRFYAKYEISGARTHVLAAVGETQTNDSGNWVATPFVQFELSHNLAPQTLLSVTAGREFTDAAQLRFDDTTISPEYDRDRFYAKYEISGARTHASLELRVGRQMTEILSGNIFGAIMQSRYFNQGGHINTNIIGADITWQASRTLAVAGRYAHNFQDTSMPGSGFSSNLVFVTVTYRPLPPVQQQQ